MAKSPYTERLKQNRARVKKRATAAGYNPRMHLGDFMQGLRQQELQAPPPMGPHALGSTDDTISQLQGLAARHRRTAPAQSGLPAAPSPLPALPDNYVGRHSAAIGAGLDAREARMARLAGTQAASPLLAGGTPPPVDDRATRMTGAMQNLLGARHARGTGPMLPLEDRSMLHGLLQESGMPTVLRDDRYYQKPTFRSTYNTERAAENLGVTPGQARMSMQQHLTRGAERRMMRNLNRARLAGTEAQALEHIQAARGDSPQPVGRRQTAAGNVLGMLERERARRAGPEAVETQLTEAENQRFDAAILGFASQALATSHPGIDEEGIYAQLRSNPGLRQDTLNNLFHMIMRDYDPSEWDRILNMPRVAGLAMPGQGPVRQQFDNWRNTQESRAAAVAGAPVVQPSPLGTEPAPTTSPLTGTPAYPAPATPTVQPTAQPTFSGAALQAMGAADRYIEPARQRVQDARDASPLMDRFMDTLGGLVYQGWSPTEGGGRPAWQRRQQAMIEEQLRRRRAVQGY